MNQLHILPNLKHHRQLLPLILLAAFASEALVGAFRGSVEMEGLPYTVELSPRHYLAFFALGVNALLYGVRRTWYRYSLGLTLAAGLFQGLIFHALESTYFISIKNVRISVQPAAFWAGLLAYLLNFERINNGILNILSTKRSPEDQRRFDQAQFTEEVKKFKKQFLHYTIENLTEIGSSQSGFVPAAREAAKQILNERNSGENKPS